MRLKKWFPYLVAVGLTLLGGALSGLLSMAGSEAYLALRQPPLAPPSWVFPVVWTILYVLMGLGIAAVMQKGGREARPALRLYLVQLLVNYLWPIFFFRWELRGFAYFWILLLILLVVLMILHFDRISTPAAWLQIPYLLWLIFAAYLNLTFWLLNR